MTDKRTIAVEGKKHISLIGRLYGLGQALSALDDMKQHDKLPGFGLARTLIEREIAEVKSTVLHLNLVACSDAGENIATVKEAALCGSVNDPQIEITFHDLLGGGEAE